MRYEIEIQGITPLIMHDGSRGLDPYSDINIEISEITRKKGSNRTEADDLRLRELECLNSFWLDCKKSVYIPEIAFRAAIEQAARKLKQGPQVREGLRVENSLEFKYDKKLGKTAEELAKTTQFTTAVVIKQSRVLKTRAIFHKWGAIFTVDCDDELVDKNQLIRWLDIAGRRIGIGAWRPTKSGIYGTFMTVSVTEKAENK